MTQTTSASVKFDLRTFLPHLSEPQIKALMNQAPVEIGEQAPLVSCVLPHGEPRRRRLAAKAINQFVAQQYQYKQLVIVNTTPEPLLPQPIEGIKELLLPGEELSIGAMRNRGIDAADGTWIKHWDDDDAYNPLLLPYMMAHRAPGKALMLRFQVRVSTQKVTAYRHDDPNGIPNTILFPKGEARYGDIDAGDDVAFVLANWSENSIVLNNAAFPVTLLNVAMYHGGNVTSERSFMGSYVEPEHATKWYLSREETPELIKILDSFGLKTTITRSGEEPLIAPPAPSVA